MAAIVPGDWLAVSGLWREGAVIASRIERLSARATARVTGLLRVEGGAVRIGGTAISDANRAAPGFAAVSGAYRDGRLVAERIVTGADELFPAELDRLIVEAFLARNPNDPGYHLSGFGIPMNLPRPSWQRSASARSLSAATTAVS